jgi:hypothetical protein
MMRDMVGVESCATDADCTLSDFGGCCNQPFCTPVAVSIASVTESQQRCVAVDCEPPRGGCTPTGDARACAPSRAVCQRRRPDGSLAAHGYCYAL